MIFDSLKNASVYASLSPLFRAAFDYLTEHDLSTYPAGRYDICGNDVYAMVQDAALKPWEEGRWEGHRRYADIQLVLEGEEIMGFCQTNLLTPDTPYDDQLDLLFFQEHEGGCALVHAGEMAIFLPQDAHRPCIQPFSGAKANKKVVVKVRVDD